MLQIDWDNKLKELASNSAKNKNLLQSRYVNLSNFKVQLNLIKNTSLITTDVCNSKTCSICHYLSLSETKKSLCNDYVLVDNTGTSFDSHFLLVADRHMESGIESKVYTMLSSAKDFNNSVVLCDGLYYPEGKKSHFYLHLLTKNSLPIEDEYDREEIKHSIISNDKGEVYVLEDHFRSGIVLKSKDDYWISAVYFECVKLLGQSYSLGKYPYLNFITWFEDGVWVMIIFPRVVHKPLQYYEKGKDQFKIVPGAIEFGGVFCVDEEVKFDSLNDEIVGSIYSQVSYNFNHLIDVILPLKEKF